MMKGVFGVEIQVNEIASANIFFVDAQNFNLGFNPTPCREHKVDLI
jgi:hypothetical protein